MNSIWAEKTEEERIKILEWYSENEGILRRNLKEYEIMIRDYNWRLEELERTEIKGDRELTIHAVYVMNKLWWKDEVDKYMKSIRHDLELITRYRERQDRQVNLDDLKSIPIERILDYYGVVIRNKICSCPIHNEDTPSCHIYEKTNSFNCFGCGAGGSVIDLVMGIEKCDIRRAIEILKFLT